MLTSWVAPLVVAALGLQSLARADEWDARVDAIMANFTTEDIIGQMSQISVNTLMNDDMTVNDDAVRVYAKLKVGSYLGSPLSASTYQNESYAHAWTVEEFRKAVGTIQNITMEENGGHPMLFGIDSVHGANFVLNTVLFGQQINGAASFNPELVYKMGEVAARDTLAAGIPWSFGPILEVSSNPLWGRTYETFGEDPYTISVMADAVIRGLQSTASSAACMKHFIAYSKTPSGHDKDGVTITDFDLLNYFAPPFIAAVNAGVHTTMENYISVNSVPTIQNARLLSTLLRNDLGFDGVAVTDYGEMNDLANFHHTARTTNEATKFSLERTSIDMSMIADDSSFINSTKVLVAENPGIIDRLTESARRVVKLKVKLGLYDDPLPGEDNVALIGNDEDVAAALQLARESVVLVQNNDSSLPLANNTPVFLTGHSTDNIAYQCGGWSITWQGISGKSNFPHGKSVKDALETIVGNDSVSYFNGLYANGSYSADDLETAKQLAAQAEYTIAVIGEAPYAEKKGDIDDLSLPAGQIEYVEALAATGTKVILVLFEGRPRLLNGLTEHVYAVIDGLLACELGGQAVAEIIYGQVNPSGRLPLTYPKDAANVAIPYNHRVTTQCKDDYCVPQWAFGHGLSFTTFGYSDLALDKTNVTSSSESLNVSVTVTNTGSVAGKETVMLFLTQPSRSYSVPEVKQLKKFTKISLEPGESTVVAFALTADDWSVYYPQIGQGFKQVAEDADYVVAIKPETDCDVYNSTAVVNPLCATFTLNTGEYPYGSLAEVI